MSKATLRKAYAARARRKTSVPKQAQPAKLPAAAERSYVRVLTKTWDAVTREALAELERTVKSEALERDAREDASPVRVAVQKIGRVIARAIAVRRMQQIARDIHRRTNTFNLREVATSLAVNPLLVPELDAGATAWARENAELIGNVGAEVTDEIAEVVRDAWGRGLRWEQIRALVGERLAVGRSRLELIARDQVLKLNADLTRERHERVGVKRYRWSTSRDERVRKAHKALEGNVYTYAEPPIVDPRTGRREAPGRDFQCRCVAIPIFDDD